MANENNPNSDSKGAEAYPRKEKAGLPWWIPLLLAFLILGPIAYYLSRPKAEPTPPNAPPAAPASMQAGDGTPASSAAATNAPPAADPHNPDKAGDKKVFSGRDIATGATAAASQTGEPLTNVVDLASASDKTTFIGRKAKLTDVNVTKFVTDRAFFVGTSDAQQMLILLDAAMDAGPNGERVSIAAGKTVSLTGIIEKLPTQEILNEQYKLTGANYDAVAKEPVYLHTTVAQKK